MWAPSMLLDSLCFQLIVMLDYMISLSMRDLQYRSLRAERVCCFYHKQEANFLLYSQVLKCDNEATYESLRQHPWAQR